MTGYNEQDNTPDEYLAYLESGYHDVDYPEGSCKKCGRFCKINWARFPGECGGAAILDNLMGRVPEWNE